MSRPVRIAGKRRRVRIGIIDDTDAPQARMLALAIGMPGVAEVEYLSTHHAPLRGKRYALSGWTDAATFGVKIDITVDGELRVERVGESSAVYPDGLPRQWQGREFETISVRPALVPIVARLVSTSPAAEARAPEPGR